MADDLKWFSCTSGSHLWPSHLKQKAELCCQSRGSEPREAEGSHSYVCFGGKHTWNHADEAERCCNGHIAVWRTIGTPPTRENRFEMREKVLKPTSEIVNMDEQSSNPEDIKHLYKAM